LGRHERDIYEPAVRAVIAQAAEKTERAGGERASSGRRIEGHLDRARPIPAYLEPHHLVAAVM